MDNKGFSHIGLSTHDLDKTRAFYEGVLGFKPIVADTITIEEGGRLRHLFFDIGARSADRVSRTAACPRRTGRLRHGH
jgi:catechol 2,3-dioxygenase-like lactoylglutathione lyase family enzyme